MRQFVPTFCFVGVAVGGDHGPVGCGYEDVVADGEVGPLRLRLVFLHHFDVVGGAFGVFVKVHHITLDSGGIDFVETSAIVTEVSEEFRGRHFGVESRGVLALFLPHIVDGGFEECDLAFVGGFVEGAVVPLGNIFCNGVLDGCIGGIHCDGFVGHRQLGGDSEGDAVLGGVGVAGGDDTPEVVFVLYRVVFDIHQNGSKGFDNGADVVIGWITINGSEYSCGLFEGDGDLFGR